MISVLQTSASPCGIQFTSFCQFVSVSKQTSERHAQRISFRYLKINRNVHDADRKIQRKHLQNWSTDSAWAPFVPQPRFKALWGIESVFTDLYGSANKSTANLHYVSHKNLLPRVKNEFFAHTQVSPLEFQFLNLRILEESIWYHVKFWY